MTMSVLKGEFSFPLTSYTKERKVNISGAHEENRTERTECYACLLRPFNVTLKHDLQLAYTFHQDTIHCAQTCCYCTIRL